MPAFSRLVLCALLLAAPTAWAKNYKLDYQVRFLPASDQAEVKLLLEDGEGVRKMNFNLGKEGRFSDFSADGRWELEGSERGIWTPAKGPSTLSYKVRINNQRDSGRFDARMTDDWVLLRGDDLVPPARLDVVDGTRLVSRLQFELPKGWKGVETGWPRVGENRFRIDNSSRLFSRPTGWIVAGKIGSRRTQLGDTAVTVAAPVGEGLRRMDILTLLTFVWPQVEEVFPRPLPKLLIVGAGEPMWRGGLSAPNSIYLHSDRPLVSENGTSSLLHELVHVASRIRDTDRSDWISEGIAEYYAIELLRRAGGLGEDRHGKVMGKLKTWSKGVSSLRTERSTGPVTARAVLLLADLDAELRKGTDNRRSLDDVTQALMRLEKVSTKDFIEISENVLGGRSKVLDSRLLR